MIKTTLTLIYGLLAALVTSGIVLGAISLSLVEGDPDFKVIPLDNQNTPSNPIQEIMPLESQSDEHDPICIVPAGWVPYTIQAGDTLENLANAYAIQAEDLKSINCLPGNHLFPGAQLHLPPNTSNGGSPDAE